MKVADLDENSDQVIDIIKNMLTTEPMDRFTVDECLHMGLRQWSPQKAE